jgi:hypothetical protein
VGHDSLGGNTTGTGNTAVGYLASGLSTTGASNTSVGHGVLYQNTASNNTGVGYGALDANTSASNNTAVGWDSLGANTTGTGNTAVGMQSGRTNTTGENNTFLGINAGYSNTIATDNTAVGSDALFANTTATGNTAVGRQSQKFGTTGGSNVSVGLNSLYTNTTGVNNTAIGRDALFNANVSSANTAVGQSAGSAITTGDNNTIIGRFNGNQGGLDIRTSSNHIVLSDGSGNPKLHLNSEALRVSDGSTMRNQIAYAHSDAASAANKIGFHMTNAPAIVHSPGTGGRAFEVWTSFAGQPGSSMAKLHFRIADDGDATNTNNSYGSLSDIKLKQDIVDSGSQWDDIKAVKVKNYRFKDQVANLGDDNAPTMLGVIAQDLEAAGMSGLVKEKQDSVDGVSQGTTTKEVKYSVLYMKAVKALQEAMDRIETLEAKVATLESN